MHTSEEEYARSARSTAKDESVSHPDADVESSGGEDDDMSTPLVTLKPNRQQDGRQGGIAGNVVSEGPITRTGQLPSAMMAGAGDRAITGSPHLSFDGSRGGTPSNSPRTSPIHGSAYGIVAPTSPVAQSRNMAVLQNPSISVHRIHFLFRTAIAVPLRRSRRRQTHTSTWECQRRILRPRIRHNSPEMQMGRRGQIQDHRDRNGQERHRRSGRVEVSKADPGPQRTGYFFT